MADQEFIDALKEADKVAYLKSLFYTKAEVDAPKEINILSGDNPVVKMEIETAGKNSSNGCCRQINKQTSSYYGNILKLQENLFSLYLIKLLELLKLLLKLNQMGMLILAVKKLLLKLII